MGYSRPTFFISAISFEIIVNNITIIILPMTGFEPGSIDVGGDQYTYQLYQNHCPLPSGFLRCVVFQFAKRDFLHCHKQSVINSTPQRVHIAPAQLNKV